MPVMRRMIWARMSEAERTALCERGLTAIFDADLKVAIGQIIDDVRANGDEAVCRALRDFDKVTLEPHQLKATPTELADATVSADVDAAIDDAIVHLRAFNQQLMTRAGDWSFESEPGLIVGEKITPITSAGLPVGTHFMANAGNDLMLLQLAAQLEHADPWFHKRPSR